MPTKLPSGVTVYNVTPHELNFWCGDEVGVVVSPPDEVVNALPISKTAYKDDNYTLVNMSFTWTKEGMSVIEKILSECPNAVIVGSVVAAQAYPEYVVATVKMNSSRLIKQDIHLVRSDRFTTFMSKEHYNGSN